MQAERWDDNRLDLLASAVAANAEAIKQQNQTTEVLQSTMLKLADVMQEILPRIDKMQSEIKGLQTENRRILDRVFGEEEPT